METAKEQRRRLERFIQDVAIQVTSGDSAQRSPASARSRTRNEAVMYMCENMTVADLAGLSYIMELTNSGRMTTKVAGDVVTAIASHIDGPYRMKWGEE